MNCCQVCARTSQHLEIIGKYKTKFFDITGIKADENYLLCSSCVARLIEAFAFREQALSTYRVLSANQNHKIKKTLNLETILLKSSIQNISSDIQNESQIVLGSPATESDIKLEDESQSSEYFARKIVTTNKSKKVLHTSKLCMFGCPICFLKRHPPKPKPTQFKPNVISLSHICPFCQQLFDCKKSFIEHVKKHEPCSKKLCHICGKLFKTPRILYNHFRSVHSNLRFKCSICEYQCRTKFDLKTHMIRHSDRRNYSCEFCEKRFKTKKILMMHVRFHTEEKLVKCIECNKKYNNRYKLKIHINVSHRGMRFSCSICDKVYSTNNGVIRHQKKSHPVVHN